MQAAGKQRSRGYRGLLNFGAQPHWTVFVTDFKLPSKDVHRIRRQVEDCPTRLFFASLADDADPLSQLVAAGFKTQDDYASIHGLITRHRSLQVVQEMYANLPRRDFTRLELPMIESGFDVGFASKLLSIVCEADYGEQDLIAERFFTLLASRKPYDVSIKTRDGSLSVRDNTPWFDIAGRLLDAETRIMPAGEVAYTGDRMDGEFVIDGAILPLAEHPDVAEEARRLQSVSAAVKDRPIKLHISAGRVETVEGSSDAARVFSRLFEMDDRYRRVTEVGISFNRACRTFIHDWPAASNESRPGVHLGLGGDPVESAAQHRPLVHIDCMAANCDVRVNSHPFLLAFS